MSNEKSNIIQLFAAVERLERESRWEVRSEKTLKSGGGGGTFDGMENRVKALEDDMKEIKGDLKKLLSDVSEMKGMMRNMPSAESFGHLKGRVESLPTTAKVATLLSIAVALVTLATRWTDVAKLWN